MNSYFKSCLAVSFLAVLFLLIITTSFQLAGAADSRYPANYPVNEVPLANKTFHNTLARSYSTTIYVNVSNNTGIEDGSQDHPFSTIQKGLGIALSGDIVQVAAGTYYEKITLKNGVQLLGAGAEATRIDGTDQNDSVVYASYTGPGTLIDGFTITHGTGKWIGSYTYGGGVYGSNSTLEIRNCVFTENHSSDGAGGLEVRSSTITVDNCIFDKNSGWWGGAITIRGGSGIIQNSIIKESSSGYGGALFLDDSAQVTSVNNLIMHNSYTPAIGIRNAKAVIINNTIVDNTDSGVDSSEGGSATITNSILWGNNDDLVNLTASYSDIEDGDPGEGNISTYPMFADPMNQDYHLLRNSLLIDAGTTNGAPLTDIDGDARPADGNGDGVEAVDIGADEVYPLLVNKWSETNAVPGSTLPYKISLDNWSGLSIAGILMTDTLPLQVTYQSGSLTATGGVYSYNNGVITWTGTLEPHEVVTITYGTIVNQNATNSAPLINTVVTDVGGHEITTTASVNVKPTARSWYVSMSGSDSGSCSTVSDPCATINSAIGKASPDDTIYVASGSYTTSTGDEVVLVNKSVSLSGGWDAQFLVQAGISIVDGQKARRGITILSNNTVTIERFSFQNGTSGLLTSGTLTIKDSFIRDNSSGRGMVNEYGAVTTMIGCTVSGNYVTDQGGGIWNFATLTLIQTVVSENTATSFGGGIHSPSPGGQLTLINSTVSDNTAVGGAGINLTSGKLRLYNSSILHNHGNNGTGGVFCWECDAEIQNSIIANNSSGPGQGISPDCGGSIDSAGYNLIGNTSGCTFKSSTGDILNVSPHLFAMEDNYALLPSSPAIDAGNPGGCMDDRGNIIVEDQRGTPRPLDGNQDGSARCDIGAHEYDPSNPVRLIFLPCMFKSCPPSLADDFSDPTSGWPIEDNKTVKYAYMNGEYQILVKPEGNIAFVYSDVGSSDFGVEVDVRPVRHLDGGSGILFGFNGYGFYEFLVRNGQYNLVRINAGSWTWTDLIGWTSSPFINSGSETNHLKIVRIGANIELYANGELLATVSDGTYYGSNVGLSNESYADNFDARFDNLVVYTGTCIGAPARGAVDELRDTFQRYLNRTRN